MTGTGATVPARLVVAPIAHVAVDNGVALVVGEVFPADTEGADRGDAVDAVRDDDDLTNRVSTVDDLDRDRGLGRGGARARGPRPRGRRATTASETVRDAPDPGVVAAVTGGADVDRPPPPPGWVSRPRRRGRSGSSASS